MIRKVSLLVVISLAVLIAGTCVTAAFWSRMAEGGETSQHLDPAPHLSTASEVHVLAFQSAAPSNSTQASRRLTTENITRIIVPVSRVENTSSSGTQPFNGFAFPAWIWFPVILVLLVILAYLFLRLLRESNNDTLADKQRLAPASTSKAQLQQSRQIPINGEGVEAERQKSSLESPESQTVRRIPIDTPEEVQEAEDNSK